MKTLPSRSVARRSVLTTATLIAGSALLLTAACGSGEAIAGGGSPASAAPTVSSPQSAASDPPSGGSQGGAPVAGSVVGLPGWLYYEDLDRLVRLTRSGTQTVLSEGGYTANVSPDGESVAFVDGAGNVVVTDRDGKHPRTVLRGSVGAGFEPVWSPDSRRLLVGKGALGEVTYGIVTVASASFAPLAHQLPDAVHVLWSADGQHLAFATGVCRLGTANVDGSGVRLVPVIGDFSDPANVDRRRSCDPYSLSPDGSLMAVAEHRGGEDDGDIGRDLVANAVIDLRTGADVALPVSGSVWEVVFEPDGSMLVRTTGATNELTLLNPDRSVRVRVTEPAAVKKFELLTYTPD